MTTSKPQLSIPGIALAVNNQVSFLFPEDINYLNAEGSYTHVYLSSGKKVTLCKKLGEIQKSLPEQYFARVHQSYLVNLANISKFNDGKESFLEMKNGSIIAVSRRKKAELLARFTRL